ncbi:MULTISPECIES: glycosyltransferase [unclassified Leptolyngbya]|uniref:glycosyltransferase n=1 Tax=unclassified Leptolyngbya TaxID=2650499 RepID=UPI00168952C2|nr:MULTISPECIES: glycosyltransferase [unclassified Leptolyngbya]MBD1913163.1 glycosyltransferase family 1 protein [Leptolyngbya sp. FACHB-8]MBD2158798.1 glycosyltransferase family 1 protein [Leptolyngbya sp. FACHB-16]
MRVLLSTIGTRGDVQPLVSLALALRALDQEVHLCVPPDSCNWIEGLGIPVTSIGPQLRSTGKVNPTAVLPTPEQRRQMMEGTVATQFETIAVVAQGCDLIVGATALQIAAPSVAEKMGIPYVFAAYCPAVLPSPYHAPPVLGMLGDTLTPADVDYHERWVQDAQRWNDMWGTLLNSHRASLGLVPVSDVRSHILTDRPWLAADPTLAPWPNSADQSVFQTGAWILPDECPLSPELEVFLDAGEPPVYFGFGSVRAPENISQVMVMSARSVGYRAIISRGWADLWLVDDEPDCLIIDEVNQQALFKRVAAVVHHGGAGTTTAAALAGVPQVVIPQMYDQHYWAQRIHHLGIGTAHAPGTPTLDSLTSALKLALQSDVAARAQSIATTVRRDGAQIAAQQTLYRYG